MKSDRSLRTRIITGIIASLLMVSLAAVAHASGAETDQGAAKKAEVTAAAPAEQKVEDAATVTAAPPETTTAAEADRTDSQDEDEAPEICDALAPFNQVMFHFNDKLYYWGLKPVATGFSYVVPEFARIGFSNAFSNLRSPVNIINNLLQLQFSRSFLELVRLVFNSVVGVGGFYDASSAMLGIDKHDADFGQTLGMYGVGHGCYLVLPVVGPSSFRDGVGLVGDQFMSPPTYLGYFFLNFWEASGAYMFEKVNDTTFRIGDYEFLTNLSVDPYSAQRNAFVQYRKRKVREAIER